MLCPESLGCEYLETPSEGLNPLCLSAKVKCMFLNGVTKLRKTLNYKQGWGYSKLRCSPKYSQPKDTDIFMSVFCVNLSHATLCRLLFVISVYFTL